MASQRRGQKGFTLLEIMAVLIILSVLAAIAVPRYISLDESAKLKAIDAGLAELNGRENLTWSDIKITESGWLNDGATFSKIDTDLGADYAWTVGPDASGGTLAFRGSGPVEVSRAESTFLQPGLWSR